MWQSLRKYALGKIHAGFFYYYYHSCDFHPLLRCSPRDMPPPSATRRTLETWAKDTTKTLQQQKQEIQSGEKELGKRLLIALVPEREGIEWLKVSFSSVRPRGSFLRRGVHWLSKNKGTGLVVGLVSCLGWIREKCFSKAWSTVPSEMFSCVDLWNFKCCTILVMRSYCKGGEGGRESSM